MDLDARPYRYFLAVVEEGSFRRAAEAMHISQPALSAQVRELERRLGFDLFLRTSRRVSLTPEGRLFLDKARRFVTETDWVNQAARDIRRNELRIGAAHHTAAIPERCALIDDFMVSSPDVPLRVLRRSPAQLWDDLHAGAIDAAVLLALDGSPGAGDRPLAAEFQRWTIARRAVRLLAPRSHPAAATGSLALGDLHGTTICIVDRSHGVTLAERVGHMFAQAGAVLVHPPEGDAASVQRQAARLNCCAVDLGWYQPTPSSLVSVQLEGSDLARALVVVARSAMRRAGCDRFIQAVEAVALSPAEAALSVS